MRAMILAGLMFIAGCSAAEQRAEEPVGSPVESPDDSNAMANAANSTGELTNAMANAADADASDTGNAMSNVSVRSGPTYCPILKRRASAADCEAITEQAESLEAGLGAFNAPATMVAGAPSTVKFAIGAAGDIVDTARTAGGTIVKTITVPTKLGRFMTARLSGAGFKIVAADGLGPERDLGASDEELWTWQVTPERKGKLELLLTVSVEAADAAGQRTRIRLATRTVPVEVSVTRADQARAAAEQAAKDAELAAKVSKSWAGFFTNLALAITALGALIGAIWYFRIKKPDAPKPPEDKPKP